MGAAAGFEPTAAPREVSEDGCLEAAGACIQAQSRKRQQGQAGQRLTHRGRAGIGVAGGGAFTGLGRNDDHHTAAAFGPQDDGAADYFKVLIVIRTEDPLVGCPFFDFHAFWVTINCPHYITGHREYIIIGIEVGIGQADDVLRLMRGVGFGDLEILPDPAGIPRVVLGALYQEI